jgi:hypothetical protein
MQRRLQGLSRLAAAAQGRGKRKVLAGVRLSPEMQARELLGLLRSPASQLARTHISHVRSTSPCFRSRTRMRHPQPPSPTFPNPAISHSNFMRHPMTAPVGSKANPSKYDPYPKLADD